MERRWTLLLVVFFAIAMIVKLSLVVTKWHVNPRNNVVATNLSNILNISVIDLHPPKVIDLHSPKHVLRIHEYSHVYNVRQSWHVSSSSSPPCPYECTWTYSQDLQNADVVVFASTKHYHHIERVRPDQIFVGRFWESLAFYPFINHIEYDFTMSYRMDADIYNNDMIYDTAALLKEAMTYPVVPFEEKKKK